MPEALGAIFLFPCSLLHAHVCETETDLQVQEEKIHKAAVLSGLVPVSPRDSSWKSLTPSLGKPTALFLDTGFLRKTLLSLASGVHSWHLEQALGREKEWHNHLSPQTFEQV